MTLHPDRKLVHFRYRGTLTVTEFRRSFLDFVDSPQFDPTWLMLSDLREVSEIEADFASIFAAVQSMPRVFAKFQNEVLCVLLASKDVHFGLSRIMAQVVEIYSPIKIWSVRSEAEACALSGLDPAVLAQILSEGRPEG
jgi:hypothetical protein